MGGENEAKRRAGGKVVYLTDATRVRDRLLTFGATPARIHLSLVAGRPVLIGPLQTEGWPVALAGQRRLPSKPECKLASSLAHLTREGTRMGSMHG
jgi:hypothetical protein